MRLLSRHTRNDDDPVIATPVGDECASFLAGTVAAVHRVDGHAPVWTWLNVIAHGDSSAVEALADDGETADVERATQATIARAVRADGRELTALQRDVLVPLEVGLVGTVMTPRRLVELVGKAIFTGARDA